MLGDIPTFTKLEKFSKRFTYFFILFKILIIYKILANILFLILKFI